MAATGKQSLSRREFLRIVAVGAVTGLTAKYGLAAANRPETVSETRLLMGTVVNLSLVSDDPARARVAAHACLDKMAALEGVLSRFRPNSQLARLNAAGALMHPNPHLVTVLAQAQTISIISDGAFDVSVKPLVDLYQDHQDQGTGPPTSAQIQARLPLVDHTGISIAADSVQLRSRGMALTLDGIAKGYIVDQGVAVLKAAGFSDVLVEAGGDLMASGTAATREPWQIGVQSPRPEAGSVLARFNLQNGAAATSGDYQQPFTADHSQHHILDPRTGVSAPELASVLVTAPSAMMADGLSTAVTVLGSEAGLALIERLSGVEAHLITKTMQVLHSSGFTKT